MSSEWQSHSFERMRKMKVLISANDTHPNFGSSLSRVFGNSPAFVIYDTNTKNFQAIDNEYYSDKHVDIGKDLHKLNIDAIITEKLCDTCFSSISKYGIDVWKDDGSISIREAINKFVIGGLFLMTKGELRMHLKKEEAIVEQENLKVEA